ncbi:MAG: aspartate aminotransferase family protein [Actinomycetota bacterium]
MAEHPEPFQDLNWEPARARRFGDRVLDLWEEFLAKLPDMPVTSRQFTETAVHDAVVIPVPDEPLPEDELVDYMRSIWFDYSMYPGHPRFSAYVTAAGTVPGVVADMAAAAMNQNLGAWRLSPAASEIESAMTAWFAQRFGLPAETAGGLIVTGGAMANFVALKAARDAMAGWDVRTLGVTAGQPLAIYASEEVHVVIDRAADMMGLGTNAVRKIPVDERFRMRADVLELRIEEDLRAGVRPIVVVGTAGTVATGSIDPLPTIADLCERHGMWFHVDAAYGGPATLADDLRPLFAGIERADSIAFDPHKWIYTPQSGGCVVVRDLQKLSDSFAVNPTYVHSDRRKTGHGLDLRDLGPQFSRGFSAFKVWISLLAHGREAYSKRISHDAELARYLGARVEEREDFELAAPVSLSTCCFRYVPPDLGDHVVREEYLSMLNERILIELQLDGRVYCSNAVLDGRFVLRSCIVNFRTEAEDLDALLDVAAELGERFDREIRPASMRV